jgi:hypothetical protein
MDVGGDQGSTWIRPDTRAPTGLEQTSNGMLSAEEVPDMFFHTAVDGNSSHMNPANYYSSPARAAVHSYRPPTHGKSKTFHFFSLTSFQLFSQTKMSGFIYSSTCIACQM